MHTTSLTNTNNTQRPCPPLTRQSSPRTAIKFTQLKNLRQITTKFTQSPINSRHFANTSLQHRTSQDHTANVRLIQFSITNQYKGLSNTSQHNTNSPRCFPPLTRTKWLHNTIEQHTLFLHLQNACPAPRKQSSGLTSRRRQSRGQVPTNTTKVIQPPWPLTLFATLTTRLICRAPASTRHPTCTKTYQNQETTIRLNKR